MALGWISILKMVPWVDVIRNAPVIADGARKLWGNVARKPPVGQLDKAGGAAGRVAHDAPSLESRLATLETAASALHEQMLASSELIKALADQNAQLIKGIEVNRRRVLLLAGLNLVLAIVLLVQLN